MLNQNMINIPQMANDIRFNMQADNMQLTLVSPQIYVGSNGQPGQPPIVNVYQGPTYFPHSHSFEVNNPNKLVVVNVNDQQQQEGLKQSAQYDTLMKGNKEQDEKCLKAV